MLLRRRFLRERPGQHELGLKHGVEVVDKPVQRRCQISMDRVMNPMLDVGDNATRVAFIPSSVQTLRGDAELDNEITA
jgi:hypothetical protein